MRRQGRSHRAYFQIVAADARAPRDGRYLERIGTYDPQQTFDGVKIDHKLALKWLACGAQPTETVRSFLSKEGILLKHHLLIKGKSPEEIERTYQDWARSNQTRLSESRNEYRKKQQSVVEKQAASEVTSRAKKVASIQAKLQENAKPAHSEEAAPEPEAESTE